MRGRGRLLILVSLIILLGAVAAVLVLSQQQPPTDETTSVGGGTEVTPINTPVPTVAMVEIVVAAQTLPRGLRLPDTVEELEQGTAVAVVTWPLGTIPENAITDLEDVAGKILRTEIRREIPVLSTMLVEDLRDISPVGSDAAAVMAPGNVAVSIPMDRLTGIAYAIRAGDYVDIILSMLFVDVDPEWQSLEPNLLTLIEVDDSGNIQPLQPIEGRLGVGIGNQNVIEGPSEMQRPRLLTQRTVQAAWVLRVGDFPITGPYIGLTPTERPRPTPTGQPQQQGDASRPTPRPTPIPPPDIITLAVSPQDAVVLVWAIEARIPITLVLRSTQDISQIDTQPVTLEYIIRQYNITVPTDLDYALEPALRSIRQLVAFQEISLHGSGGE